MVGAAWLGFLFDGMIILVVEALVFGVMAFVRG